MKLPYPFVSGDRTFVTVTLKSPTGGTLADARKHAEAGEVYQALLAYVAGSVASLEDSSGGEAEGRDQVKAALRSLPWPLAEWLSFKSMVMAGADDAVDMPFNCPRCGNVQYRDEDPVRVDALPIASSDAPPEVDVALPAPVEFKDAQTGEVIESVSSLRFRLPTVGDCIKCSGAAGSSDDTRLQFAIWGEAIVAANGLEVDQKWRATWGFQTFERMDIAGVRAVGKALGAWAMDSAVDAACPKCGKRFRQEVPTGSFFASGLKGD